VSVLRAKPPRVFAIERSEFAYVITLFESLEIVFGRIDRSLLISLEERFLEQFEKKLVTFFVALSCPPAETKPYEVVAHVSRLVAVPEH